jgi:uncharacterized protein YjiS (DUF1127 family)
MAILNARLPSLPRFRLSLPQLPAFHSMLRAAMTRRQLAEMDDRMLKDIGISRIDAMLEADRLPWDLTHRGQG